MKVLVIGGVAAGTKAAAKIKREIPSAQVKILTKSKDISYAGCGLPYYVGGVVDSREELIVNTPERFSGLTGTEVVTECEVTSVNAKDHSVTALKNGEAFEETYDKLIIAVGAVPAVPPMDGTDLEGVFTVRSVEDAVNIRAQAEKLKGKKAVVVGAGMIGLEMADNLKKAGMDVTITDMQDQILPGILDKEMAEFAQKKLREDGMTLLLSAPLKGIEGNGKVENVLCGSMTLHAELVIIAVGVKPATAFLANSGLSMDHGAILVNEKMQTNLEDIYAAGDCVVLANRLTGKPQLSQMGSTANITGRILAKGLAGKDVSYKGALGTGICQMNDTMNMGRTGLTEIAAKAEGYQVTTTMCIADEKPGYMPGAAYSFIKLIADTDSHRLLGVQVLGKDAVDTIVDMASMAISANMTLEDLEDLDLAYAPPFATAIHPLVQASYVLLNKMSGAMKSMTPMEFMNGAAKDYTIIDVQKEKSITGAQWIDLAKVNGPVEGLDKDAKLLLVCNRGRRAYLLQNRLMSFGYTNVVVLEGGTAFNTVRVKIKGRIPESEIKRVKGLGCLIDKRYGDRFNMRVITKNGKITVDEHRAVAECAEKFGSGEVTMTTRLTLEIQCIPYENIDDAIKFLNEHGLQTGGTGSLVRPVVSCKGTTCQYGLCDTFGLSEKLHHIYYEGWHSVTLPHKFKIAVGGCPNNCVKPSLNDMGIIGQRVPSVDLSKCRGCKVCQVEAACPIKVAKLQDGKIQIDPNACNHCGRCVGKCPFGAMEESTYGYKVYIGGRWGKRVHEGEPLHHIFHTEEEVIALVEKALLLFRDEGITGERFSDTIERLGFDYVEDKLLNGEINKEEILKKNVVGGAKC